MMEKRSRKTPNKAKPANQFEKGIGNFSQEVSDIGRRFQDKIEHHERLCGGWWCSTLGAAGPLVSSILGIILIYLVTWLLTFMARFTPSNMFVARLIVFLNTNLAVFFLILLSLSYLAYVARANPKAYLPFSPLSPAIGLTAALWIISSMLIIAVEPPMWAFPMSTVILQVSDFVMTNLLVVFSVVILVSYIIFLAGPHPRIPSLPAVSREAARPAYHHSAGGIKRLYRSGNEKILGGVCGGIAEYLGIDPVIVRLLWVIFVLAWGAGILAYLIAWIIIPRNPNHRWKN